MFFFLNFVCVCVCVFMLRRHVGGIFMPCDRRGVSYTIFILVFLHCVICSPKFLNTINK